MGMGVGSGDTDSVAATLASALVSTDGFSSSLGFFERPVNLRNKDKRLSKTYDAYTSLKSWGVFIRSELYQQKTTPRTYYDATD
jgi:hypothetical protein